MARRRVKGGMYIEQQPMYEIRKSQHMRPVIPATTTLYESYRSYTTRRSSYCSCNNLCSRDYDPHRKEQRW